MDERAAHRVFRTLLLAHAYPGQVQRGLQEHVPDLLRLLQEAVWMDAPRPPLVIGPEEAAGALEAADRGTELEPELGATVVRLVDEAGPGLPVSLEGPGVAGRLETALPLSRSELEARNRACSAYPLGIDLVFLEPGGGIRALPRTTRVRLREGAAG